MIRHVLADDDLTSDELAALVEDASRLKASPASGAGALAGKRIALVFEKPSTRTRVSFESAVLALGGHPLVLRGDEMQLGRGETIEDTARVLSRYVHGIVLRTSGQERLERLARGSSVPVVNGLSDRYHPCQALADLLTVREHKGRLAGVTLAYVGDGNNVASSLLLAGAAAGMHVRAGCPPGRQPSGDVVARATGIADAAGGSVSVGADPSAAARGADVLYTDVWVSMGDEEPDDAEEVFAPYRLDGEILAEAAPEAIVMHCLPAHRDQEITAEVIDGPRSVVWEQAGNRIPAQMALLRWLLG